MQEFMVEFDAQWRAAAPAFEDRDPDSSLSPFELWGELMAQTARNHFTESSAINLAQSFGRPAEYGPDAERFLRAEVHEDVAYVLTQSTSPLARLHEYTVRVQDADWRISAITDHSDDPTQPHVDRASIDERVRECSADAPFTEMPAAQAGWTRCATSRTARSPARATARPRGRRSPGSAPSSRAPEC
ncbi:hypothetical protein NKG05_07395 [Oerskovia sp. M15]